MSKFADIIGDNKLVLVDFSAEWCGPCKTLSPILKEVKNVVGEKATIVKIDIDKNQSLASSYRVQSVPTMMLFKDGELKWRESGVKPMNELVSLIERYS